MSLGIDIGTTSIKICYIDKINNVNFSCSKVHNSTIKNLPSSYHEQDPHKILETIIYLIKNPPIQFNKIESLRISGQMHGIILWNSLTNRKMEKCSNLITWMDERYDDTFLKYIRKKTGGSLSISKGYGLGTLLWLAKNNLSYIEEFNRCGTIMDFVCCYLKNNFDDVFITDQNAVSWGFFNETSNNFSFDTLHRLFPKNFFGNSMVLPDIVTAEKTIGHTIETSSIIGLPNDIKIKASIGDLQGSLSVVNLNNPTLFIIIGTSAQISFILPDKLEIIEKLKEINLLVRNKFISNYSAWTGALMNGGNALTKITNLICNLYSDIMSIDDTQKEEMKERIFWEKLLSISPNITQIKKYGLLFEKLFLDERSNSIIEEKYLNKGLFVCGLREDTSINDIFSSIAYKIVENMHNIISTTTLLSMGISKMVLVGKADTPLFKNLIIEFYRNQTILDLKETFPGSVSIDSALGSAMFDEIISFKSL
uniref:FGGY_N domain-containing protein n=1 Tax=Strongyloides papillosus TaxID=174720 RepID=A0A0N5BLK9_STREA